jgi:hypothetical protein
MNDVAALNLPAMAIKVAGNQGLAVATESPMLALMPKSV